MKMVNGRSPHTSNCNAKQLQIYSYNMPKIRERRLHNISIAHLHSWNIPWCSRPNRSLPALLIAAAGHHLRTSQTHDFNQTNMFTIIGFCDFVSLNHQHYYSLSSFNARHYTIHGKQWWLVCCLLKYCKPHHSKSSTAMPCFPAHSKSWREKCRILFKTSSWSSRFKETTYIPREESIQYKRRPNLYNRPFYHGSFRIKSENEAMLQNDSSLGTNRSSNFSLLLPQTQSWIRCW